MANLDFIYNRKSVRQFKDTPVPKEDIIELLKAGTYAPSPKHQQNWHFVVLQNRDIINKMADIVTKSHENIGQLAKNEKDFKRHMSVINYYTCFKHAPVVIIVYSCEYKMIEYKILKENNQEHLLKYIDMVNEEQRKNLIEEIGKIDFEQLNALYNISSRDNEKAIESIIIEHTKFLDKYKMDEEEQKRYINAGNRIIKSGEYAVVTMAGGQGTRLGHDGPKGTFKLNVKPKPKYLFEIIVDGLKEANEKYGITLNWYIMTSTENNEKTAQFFEEHNYFEYPKENIKFFKQENLPLVRENGKLMVDENMQIKYAANGNGSIYRAMKNAGILEDMRKKGVKWIFIGSVDNVLLNMVDPMLVGLTSEQGNQIRF